MAEIGSTATVQVDQVWIAPLCNMLVEGCTTPAEYRVWFDHLGPLILPPVREGDWCDTEGCDGHLACEEHARAAREGRTVARLVKVESLRAHEKRRGPFDVSDVRYG